MSSTAVRALACLVLGAAFSGSACERAAAEVIPVPSNVPAASPTLTMFWEGQGARAVLILVPGGEGQLNLKPQQPDVGNQFYQTLKQLSRSSTPTDILDVVLFDSPERLANARSYPISRATTEHLSRIHDVIQFYRTKTGKPVWLMGHSNGAVSVAEYVRYARGLGEAKPIAGLIVSGARDVTRFESAPLDFPVLFMSHRNDGCPASDLAALTRNFKKVQALNKAPTSLVFLETGALENGSPCSTGYHMYNGATQEVVTALRSFIVPFLP
jgi:pimeloyl-ACP methyl ester carboxylesterase